MKQRPAWAEIDESWLERAINWQASEKLGTLVGIRVKAAAWLRNDVWRRYDRWTILDRLRPEDSTELVWLDQELDECRTTLGREGFALLEFCDYSSVPPDNLPSFLGTDTMIPVPRFLMASLAVDRNRVGMEPRAPGRQIKQ